MSDPITPEDVPEFYSRLARATEKVREKMENRRSDPGDRLDLTDWKLERPNLSIDFTAGQKLGSITTTLENIPHDSQEFIIVEELLKVLCGGESDFIKIKRTSHKFGHREFEISPSIDKLNADFLRKCLPLASNFSVVARFVEENARLSQGRVNHALADSMDSRLFEQIVFVEMLQTKHRRKGLHLHEIWYHIQNSFISLNLLAAVVVQVSGSSARGGRTLSLLHDMLVNMIAPIAVEMVLCRSLTIHSANPYMESIVQWIYNGIIYDPFDEFMIVENPKWKKKDYSEGYWEMMYQLRPHLVPNFLNDVQYYILNSGKYLNVIRECVKSEDRMNLAPINELVYSDDHSYNNVIIEAYKHSSKSLLNYMLNEYNLIDRITVAKKFFLLEQGDFVVQLLDTCHEELEKNVNEVIPTRLAALVEMAIRLTSTRTDCYTEHFTSCLKPLDLESQVKKILVDCIPKDTKEEQDSATDKESDTLSGYESFMLTVKCDWPVSLVFNAKVQSVYQMLFRHLFYCKYVERLLNNSWVWAQSYKGADSKHISAYYTAITLRNRMTFYLYNMQFYMMEEVIETAWKEFTEVVKTCESVDDLMRFHWNFLEKCTQDCLLTNLELLSVFRRILTICKEFVHFLTGYHALYDKEKSAEFRSCVLMFQSKFNDNLILFLTIITRLAENEPTGKLLNLFYRHNFNHYYNKLLQEANMEHIMTSSHKASF